LPKAFVEHGSNEFVSASSQAPDFLVHI
jgi:hypothetical protein